MATVPEVEAQTEDQRIVLHGVSWRQYEAILEAIGDSAGVRTTYCEGALELMSPSDEREYLKTMIARLLEIYALEKNIDLRGYGSTTFRKEAKERGLEPDECYAVGPLSETPSIALEIVLSRPYIDKLEVYRGLAVPEVWIWRRGRFAIYGLTDEGYSELERSRLLPDLDLTLLARYVGDADQTGAVRSYREAITSHSQP